MLKLINSSFFVSTFVSKETKMQHLISRSFILFLAFLAYAGWGAYAIYPGREVIMNITNHSCIRAPGDPTAPIEVWASSDFGFIGCRVFDEGGNKVDRIKLDIPQDRSRPVKVMETQKNGVPCSYRVEISGGTNAIELDPTKEVHCYYQDTIPYCICRN